MADKSQSFAANSIALPTDAVPNDRRQWVHICPSGIIKTRDGRGPYTLRDAGSVIAACQSKSGSAKMLVDYEHQSFLGKNSGSPAIAAGWIVGMQGREDGIWALVEWTEKAAAHIKAREYRYLSPVLFHSPDGAVTRIENVALTNSPNLHEMTALSRQERPAMQPKLNQPAMPTTDPNAPPQYSDTTDFTETEIMEIRQMLNLPGNAKPSAVMEAIRALLTAQNSASFDPAEYVPIGLFEQAVRDANSLRQGIALSEAQHYVGEKIRSGQIAGAYRDWGIDLCTKNKPAFDAFLQTTGNAFSSLLEPVKYASEASLQASLNSSTAGVEADICERMGLTSEQFNAAR
jgi:phage I-like protein